MPPRTAALPLLALLLAAAAPRPRASHPDVGPNPAADACETCHAEATPRIVAEWTEGPHGLSLVKCFVCHGSTGKDFARAPDVRRCQGCHPGPAAAAPASGKGSAGKTGCFACHAPHTLAAEGVDPHSK